MTTKTKKINKRGQRVYVAHPVASDSIRHAGREGVVTGISGETVMVALRGDIKPVPFSVDELGKVSGVEE